MSTKVTYLYDKDWHFYFDYKDWKMHLYDYKAKQEIALPEGFTDAVKELCSLHHKIKETLRLIQQLDKIDGGLFSYDPRTGKAGEFDGKEFVPESEPNKNCPECGAKGALEDLGAIWYCNECGLTQGDNNGKD